MAVVFSSAPPHPVPKLHPSSASHFSPSARLLLSSFRCHNIFPLHSPPQAPAFTAGAVSTGDWSTEHRLHESIAILDLMESQSIIPDAPILCSILKSCADARSLRLGRAAHEKALTAGLHTDPLVANNLLLLYSRCGLISAARQVFDEMPARNVVSWTTAISMYHHAGPTHDALNLCRLLCDGDAAIKPNAYTYTTAQLPRESKRLRIRPQGSRQDRQRRVTE
ncbi:Pentatricopeptide repeat-containing protein [Platanthera guangdongensis]|uniref:Pentatricopeptide repeat-containing protein n=1 Tax=Platanthera guangdongensis TaxID=2320717 RepID=A0ABR2M3C6_9ASPA